MSKAHPVIDVLAMVLLLLVFALFVSRSAVAQSLTVHTSLMEDSSGLVYLGCEIQGSDIPSALGQLKIHLGEEQFRHYRAGQSLRDGAVFHVTLINPFEMKDLGPMPSLAGKTFSFDLLGLGTAANQTARTFFVVATSPEAQAFRANLGLKKVDFHVTLGFSPEDVFGVSKGPDTLLSLTSTR